MLQSLITDHVINKSKIKLKKKRKKNDHPRKVNGKHKNKRDSRRKKKFGSELIFFPHQIRRDQG